MENTPELIVGGRWFNLPPGVQGLTLYGLRGKVVLVDFWTYTCINCIRTLPHLKSWHEKYGSTSLTTSSPGLVIIGVHTPEFEFEKNPANVAKAIADFGIKYPVMQDNDYATWQAYANRYWPAKYFIDREGKIRFTHFGEGDYDESEKMIQQLLHIDISISNPDYTISARTPELYLGSSRAESGFFTLDGQWDQSPEYNRPQSGSTLTLPFEAKDAFLVMRPKIGKPGKVKVILDGRETQAISVDTDKLYQLVKLDSSGHHTLKLEFPDSNLELYAFTFG